MAQTVFDIYSIGDTGFLQSVLNATAMLTATHDFAVSACIGAALGVFMVVIRGLLQGDSRGVRYQDLLVGVLIYLCMFVPKATVKAENAYNGNVVVVANVPIGVAAAGYIISNIGYNLTNSFEQAFGTPPMTTHGFADSLQVLTTVRRNLLSRIQLGKANAPTNGTDLESSFINYIKECTLTGVDLDPTILDSIMRTKSIMGAIRFASDIYTTEIYIGGRKIQTCTDAWTTLNTYVTTTGIQGVGDLLKGALKVANANDANARINDALTGLTAGNVSASDYMLSSLVTPMFEKGVSGRYEDGLKWNKAAMIEQAVQQRNSQWAAEQTLFSRLIHPMMTWIEGYTYALTPLMAFMVMLGAKGVQMMGQYFLLLIWIQLWMPILSIINMFITMGATAKMAALNAAQYNLPSIQGIYQMDMAIQDWISIGGMLASSTPAITMMLVYGGAVTATHFMGRMQGGDFVNEKIQSPDISSPAPVLNMQPKYQNTPLGGTSVTGAEKVLPSYTAGQDLSASVSSASAYAKQASSTFMDNLGSAVSSSAGVNHDGSTSKGLSNRISSSGSATDKFMQGTAEGYANKYSELNGRSEELTSMIAGAASGGASGKLAGAALKAEVSDRLSSQFGIKGAKNDEIATDIAERVSSDQSWQTELARNIATDAQTGTREVASLGLQSQDLSTLQKSATDAVSASDTYSSSVSAQSRFGSSSNFGSAETGLKIASNDNLMTRLDSSLDKYGLRGDTQRLAADWRSSGLITNKDQAHAAAGLALLTGHSPTSYRKMAANEAVMAKNEGYQLIGDTWDAPKPSSNINPQANESQQHNSPVFGTTSSNVQGASLHNPRSEAKNLPERAASIINEAKEHVGHGEQDVNRFYQNERQEIAENASQGTQIMADTKQQLFRNAIHEAATGDQSVSEKNLDVLGGSFSNTVNGLEQTGHAVSGGFNGFVGAFNKAQSEGSGFLDSVTKAWKAYPEGGNEAVDSWANEQTKKVAGNLTAAQQEVYKRALLSPVTSYLGDSGVGVASSNYTNAVNNLKAAEGEAGGDVAKVLQRAATQNRPDLVRAVENYNNSQGQNHSSDNKAMPTAHPSQKKTLKTPSHLKDYIDQVEAKYHIPNDLLERMGLAESRWNNNAVSEDGAVGSMQLMPDTAKRFGVTNPRDPYQAIEGAGKYVSWLLKRYDGDQVKAVAGYNAGEGNVDKYHGVPPFKETQTYVRRVLGPVKKG